MKSKQLIFALALITTVAIFSNFTIEPKTGKSGLKANKTNTMSANAAFDPEPFNYTPPKPVNGVLKGVIEVGATGFNSFIINIDKAKRWEMKKKEFGRSLAMEQMSKESDIWNGLKEYISEMLAYGVAGKNIHFVVSSGAADQPVIVKILASLKKRGYVVNVVTAELEAQYALKATLPRPFFDNSFVIDMGSSNTKISFLKDSKRVGFETYGSKYFENKTSDDAVYKGVMAVCAKIPAGRRLKCFIIGGVPYDLSAESNKNEGRYTVLNGPDKYDKLAAKKGAKIKCGLNIYKAIQDATGCKQFIFDNDSNFTLGYLLSLN